ncbi:MAG: hypothetical protein ACE5G2_11345 [Candidatus Krumholzibacteriia bacterium]
MGFGKQSGARRGERGAGRLLREQVLEARNLPCRAHLDPEFLLLPWPEPAMAPAPEAHRSAVHPTGTLRPQLALEKNFRPVVEAEHRGVLEGGEVVAEPLQERLGDLA